MKSKLIMLVVLLVLVGTIMAAAKKTEKDKAEKKSVELKTEQQKAGYAIGIQMGGNFKKGGLDIDLEAFLQGFSDAFSGKDLALNEIEIRQVLQDFDKRMKAAQQKKMEDMAKEGVAFLEENKKKKGVVVLPSGLQYKVIREGTGAIPKKTDIFVANYKGTFIDGTEFDSSYKKGTPLELPVTGVIPGWTEALQLMKIGAKWELYVPFDLAYGPRGRGSIPPNSTLIFEMELLDTKEAPPKVSLPPNFQIPSPTK
ncbi:MAG: FKBP-type peptidyl-prolyl cis-trans isomerase [Planctomycetes bacterium]|nr:FKBP-type peptidyl-prolyl cis-trans isomerase [Planctomycetota bacterium]